MNVLQNVALLDKEAVEIAENLMVKPYDEEVKKFLEYNYDYLNDYVSNFYLDDE